MATSVYFSTYADDTVWYHSASSNSDSITSTDSDINIPHQIAFLTEESHSEIIYAEYRSYEFRKLYKFYRRLLEIFHSRKPVYPRLRIRKVNFRKQCYASQTFQRR